MCVVMQHMADTEVSWDPGLGAYVNARLGACNVWDVPIDLKALAQAQHIFDSSIQEPLVELCSTGAGRRRHALRTDAGQFFVMRPPDWGSDICWVSCDDEETLGRFEKIFRDIGLPQAFAPFVGHSSQLRMYSAFYVVRTKCSSLKLHCDYVRQVGTDALTLITPLRDYDPSHFQLNYARTGRPADLSELDHLPSRASLDRYVYQKGRAVVFGSGFWHSTEIGSSASVDVPNVYLCFTFGTDRLDKWGAIAATIGTYQSRMIRLPDGNLGLTELGQYLQESEPEWT
jgi:hypothetical protein